MNKHVLTIGLVFLFVFSSIVPISIGSNVKTPNNITQLSNRGKTLYIGGTGPNNYTKIQDAINNASAGDTVFVYDYKSPYYERLSIKKSISLIGENRNTTVIDGEYKGVVVDIQADRVTVSSFKLIQSKKTENDYDVVDIKNCNHVVIKDDLISLSHHEQGEGISGVHLDDNSSNNSIQDNIIFNGGSYCDGVAISSSSRFNNISGNELDDYVMGIGLDSDNIVYGNYIHGCVFGIANFGMRVKIINNIITNNSYTGILSIYANCGDLLILGNTITNNGDGSEFASGIGLMASNANNEIKNNIISGNNPTGIYLLNESNDQITYNYISNNKQLGIYVDYSDNNLITDNNISFNGRYGIIVEYGVYNKIYRNNFIDNGINAYFVLYLMNIFSNRWNQNYWSDYKSNGLYPKIITGNILSIIPWIQFDWHPAIKPYDIGVQ